MPAIPGLAALGSYVARTSRRRGLLGDDRFWRVVFFAALGRRVLRRVLRSEPEVLSLEKLKPGDALTVTALPPPDRRRRRRSS